MGHCGYCFREKPINQVKMVQLRHGIGKEWQEPKAICSDCRKYLGPAYFRYVREKK